MIASDNWIGCSNSVLNLDFNCFLRNVSLTKRLTKLAFASSGMVFFASTTAMDAASDGISPSAIENATFQLRLMVWFIWYRERAAKRICSECDTSRACVWKSLEVSWGWDSGSVTVMVTELLMRIPVGTQCPGSTWKKYLLRSLKCHGWGLDASQQVKRKWRLLI